MIFTCVGLEKFRRLCVGGIDFGFGGRVSESGIKWGWNDNLDALYRLLDHSSK